MSESYPPEETAELTIRRWVDATPERVWHAWTDASELQAWWGPADVRCINADIDLRVGGRYRICNELPDGRIVWIDGVYDIIERPRHLRYSWQTDLDRQSIQWVDVRFEPSENGTEIVLCHRRIPNETLRQDHKHGWLGCLDGIEAYLSKHP